MPNAHQLVARDTNGQLLSGATLRAYEVTLSAQGVPTKGVLSDSLYDAYGSPINQSISPLSPSGLDGLLQFQLDAGVHWLEITKGPDTFTIPVFYSGNAASRNTGTGGEQLAPGVDLLEALLGRALTLDDQNKALSYNHSTGRVELESDRVPPIDTSAIETNGKRFLGVSEGVETAIWFTIEDLFPSLATNTGKVLTVVDPGGGDPLTIGWEDLPQLDGDAGVVYPVETLQNALVNESGNDNSNTAGRILVTGNSNGSRDMILPAQSQSAVRAGAVFTVVNKGPNYTVTFKPGTNVTINGGTNDWTLEDFGVATLFKIDDDDWVVTGATEVTP